MALTRVLVVVTLLLVAWEQTARAETVVVVLDRGAGAGGRATEEAALAQRLVRRCQERGDTVRACAVGARPSGKPRVVDLKVPPDEAQWKGLGATEGTAFDGRSDVRAALAAALRGTTPKDALVVVLVGPFGRVEPVPEGAGFALETWNRTAPPGSRLIPLSLSTEAAKVVEGAKGYQPRGAVVFGLADVVVEAQPWSAFDEAPRLEARLSASIDAVAWGEGPATPGRLAAQGGAADAITATDGGLRLTREHAAGLETRVTLSVQAPDAWDLSLPSPPHGLTWTEHKPEVRWLTPDGRPPRLEALDLEVGVAREARFRYRRTVPAEATTAESHRVLLEPRDGAPSLRMTLRPERVVSALVVEGEAVLSLTADARLAAAGMGGTVHGFPPRHATRDSTWLLDDAIAWSATLAPGRVRVGLTAPGVQALPAASTDPPWDLALTAENRNAPAEVELVWRAEPPEADGRLELRLRRGDAEESVWRPGEARSLAVGAPWKVRLVSVGDDPFPLASGALRLEAVAHERLEVTVAGEAAWRARRPRLLHESGVPTYVTTAKESREERPLRLTLDPDGGDGPWLTRLLGRAPTVVAAADAPQSFRVATLGPGLWEVRRDGPWRGPRPSVFDDREERVPLTVSWSEDRDPLRVEATVHVPARWGRMGWVIVGLAAAAVLLGLFALRAHRVVPIGGTLLYTIEGVEAAVGRLPLAAVCRRRTTVTADARGRLELGGAGEALLRLVPTRVGGMAEIPRPGAGAERRLLVDGLTLRVGRHALRYVQPGSEGSAAPPSTTPAVPDLLGPEYDLPHGPRDPGAG